MFRKTTFAGLLLAIAVVLLPGVASAQQSLAINVGYFALRGESSRPTEDVLVQDLSFHAFNIKDFNGATVSGEWLVPLGQLFEAGIGVGFYQRTVPTVYLDLVNADGSEITQDFKLRVVPITGMIRFIPTGRRAAIQPYVGVGVGVLPWRYAETGDFVDGDNNIFRGNFVDSGTAVGPVVAGGVRIPISTGFAFGGEIRYQQGQGTLKEFDSNGDRLFNGSKIDLGGFTYQATIVFRF